MAYGANEWLFIVHGFLQDGAELFDNVWCALDVTSGSAQEAVDRLHTFYEAAADLEMSSHTTITSCKARQLSTGFETPLTWTTITGDDLADPMPGQLAVRVSLKGLPSVNGGPFIPGWSKNAGDENGLFNNAAALAEAANTLCEGLITDGWQLRINRPTVPGTVAAISGRVGRRFDVIRRRANEIGEAYVSFATS